MADLAVLPLRHPQLLGRRLILGVAGVVAVVVLATISLFVGVADVTPKSLLDSDTRAATWEMLTLSRVPRTIALVLAGAALGVAGLVMQLLTRNPFVEPSTAGTMEFAGVGILAVAIYNPEAPVMLRMVIAALCALAGTFLFITILGRLPLRDILVVPLIGIMLSGVVAAASTFVAYRLDLLQSMNSWLTGDFSAVVQGRYEILWLTAALTLAVVWLADRLTVAGLGESVSTNLGINHRRTMVVGLTLVSIVTAAVVVTVGMLPLVGLVVPNVVAMIVGSNARRSIGWVALAGAGLVLGCDILARTVIAPYELPIGSILGVVGGVAFVALLLKRSPRVR